MHHNLISNIKTTDYSHIGMKAPAGLAICYQLNCCVPLTLLSSVARSRANELFPNTQLLFGRLCLFDPNLLSNVQRTQTFFAQKRKV